MELTEKEKKVLSMLYGVDDGYLHTLDEVGFVFNVSADTIRKIKKRALKKIPNSDDPENVIKYLQES